MARMMKLALSQSIGQSKWQPPGRMCHNCDKKWKTRSTGQGVQDKNCCEETLGNFGDSNQTRPKETFSVTHERALRDLLGTIKTDRIEYVHQQDQGHHQLELIARL